MTGVERRPRVSVIVPFHDAERWIDVGVRALLAQDFPPERHEIVMVDNASTDRSADVVRRHPRIRLLGEATPGSYAARNRGLAVARGEIVAFTDADCAPRADWLRAIDEAFRDPAVALVMGGRRLGSESVGLAVLADYEAQKAAHTLASDEKKAYYGYTNNLAVRRDVVDRVGAFVGLRRGADVVFVHRVLDAYGCDAVRYAPRMVVRHLEIASVRDWWRKMRIYGRSSRTYGPLARSRPLHTSERLKVFRETTRRGRYPLARSLLLLLILAVGVLYYELGRRSRR